MPDVHGTDKGLILYVKSEHQISVVIPPTHPMPPIHQRVDKGPTTNIVPPIPKPRIGQGRAGIRRKPKVAPPTPKPIHTPAPPIPTPSPRAVQTLPQPVVQSQDRTLPQHHIPSSATTHCSPNHHKHHKTNRA